MRIYIVIPAHNEAEFIGQTLQSLVQQTKLPDKIVVVDDNSSDETADIVESFILKYPFIKLVRNQSGSTHLPGSKVINAFNKGYETMGEHYDVICKFDADLLFPENYLEKLSEHFQNSPKTGICGGFCSIFEKGSWIKEDLTGKDHVRGALKAYRKACFLEIGKLKPAMGWDTLDELLAQYHGWKIKTDESLLVKHLKPTGKNYNKTSKYKQGEAFYRLHYGFALTGIASAKLAFKKKQSTFLLDSLRGYFKAKKEKQPFLVSEEEGRFIRALRWKNIRKKLF
ncbi:glycosyltransferase family A protein [Zunongwangia sp. F363]|uniref:Glycosyltransferase family A protein n=1 Tax=Autumnicola tepida TaxID=3075595 RepID=A0ABU3C537_9FLAO|nr:glycosyltransferase family A protein [Zunongwangia sp. F363]MDT0641452.1 glycosyltransferase family A protein [Zunongwangia sp. F363]